MESLEGLEEFLGGLFGVESHSVVAHIEGLDGFAFVLGGLFSEEDGGVFFFAREFGGVGEEVFEDRSDECGVHAGGESFLDIEGFFHSGVDLDDVFREVVGES